MRARAAKRLAAIALALGLGVQCTTIVGINKDYQLGAEPDAATTDAAPDAAPDVATDAVACGDTVSNAANCGRCGHDCLGGACQAGVCQPVVVALGQANPEAIAVSPSALYWTNIGAGTVATASLSGSPPSILVSGQGSPRGIAITGAELFFTTLAGGQIQHVALPATTASTLVASQESPYGVAADGTAVIWTANVPDGGVWQSGTDGSSVRRLAPGALAYALAIDARAVFFTTLGSSQTAGDGAVVTVARAAGSVPQTLVANVKSPRGIAVDDANVYYTSYGDGTVSKVPRAGGAPTVIAASRFQPAAIAVDAAFVYWLDEYEGGSVLRMPLEGGQVTTIAAGQSLPHALAMDDKSIYWANYGDGHVMRVAK